MATKKEVKPKVIKEEIEVVEKEVFEQPIEKVRTKSNNEIDRNEEVSCRSVTTGLLQYLSRNGSLIMWNDFGAEQWISVDELIYMNASKPKFLQTPWLIVESDKIAKYLGLNKMYENIIDIDNLDTFFSSPISEIREKLTKVPTGFKENIAVRARQMIDDGSLDSMKVIKILEETLNVDLQIILDID